MIKKEIKATIHVACTYLKLVHQKIVSRFLARVKAIKRNPTFGTRSLRNPDVVFIFVQPKFTVDMLSSIWERQKRI